MQLPNYVHLFLAASLILAIGSIESSAADKNAIEWLRGKGKDLEMCLKGEVFEATGQPAKEFEIAGHLNSGFGTQQLTAVIDGHRFEIWIPVNKSNWYAMQLSARSTQNDTVAYLMLNASELRQAIVKGANLTLKNPTRKVAVKVVDKGQPVSGATVKVDVGFGVELQSRTDDSGVTYFRLLPERQLTHLMAWTDDFRIGGYDFDRGPVRDPGLNEHLVELSACRDQKIRFVDQVGRPVPGIDFRLQTATPPPNYNFIGANEYSVMKTDANGEVIDKWFPDWEAHFCYPELRTDQWVLDGDVGETGRSSDSVTVFKVKKSRIAERKRVTGQVKSNRSRVGGFRVTLDSHQGEQKRHRDVLGAFTDADGSFSVDVLPAATYCTYVLDGRWVGNIIDLIPYETEADRINSPQLTVSEGQDVEVIVTSGPNRRPYSNLSISFQRQHSYTYREDGQVRHATSGPQWWSTTNEAGRAVTQTTPGELKVFVYSPLWRTEQTLKVKAGEPVTISFHREVDEKQPVTGRLILPEGMLASLKDAQIKIGSVDGASREEHTLTCGPDGHFSLETLSSQLGIVAVTKDGQLSASLIVESFDAPIELHLIPTVDFQGKLISESGEPVTGQKIHAITRMKGKNANGLAMFSNHFDVQKIEVMTDEVGNYTLKSLPTNLTVLVWTKAADGSSHDRYLEDFILQPNELRPRAVSRLGKNSQEQKKRALSKRYRATLRDCVLSGFHSMVIVADEQPSVTAFVDKHFIDCETNSDAYAFMPIVVSGNQANFDSEDQTFVKEMNWQQPGEGRLFAYALDGKGDVLGQLEINVADESAASTVAEFVHQHAPAKVDAEKQWDEAFAEAKRSDRRVWARVSQRYCGPCFRLTRWLDDQRKILDKDYVMLKIDRFRDQNGDRVAERITRGTHHGVPFSVIFDANGKRLVDSAGSLGNFGFPSGVAEKDQFRQMLLKSRTSLADQEIGGLVESLDSPTRDAEDR